MIELATPTPFRRGETLEGAVIYVDGFGNLVTNLDRETIDKFVASFRPARLLVRIGNGAAMEIFNAYGDAPADAALATFGSFELLEIAVRDASAASFFKSDEGAPVTVMLSK